MPKLNITNNTTSDIIVQDATGNSALSLRVPASSSKNGVKITAAQLSALEAGLNTLQTAGKLSWTATPDFADPAEEPVGAPMLRKYYGLGNNGAGHVTLASAKVGDLVLMAIDMTNDADVTADFESAVTVAGQIQQTTANLSAAKILILLQAQA